MHQDLKPGNLLPDIELPTHEGERVKLSKLMNNWPTAVIFIRGHY